MIDGSFVEATRQHNTREENKIIKEDRGGEKHFGYKNHTKVDKGSKLIKKGVTTDASVHDSKPVKEFVDENDRGEDLFADSAYIGKGVKRVMRKFGMKDKVIKRNTRGKKISKWQETINRKNSKLRVRV